jgi:hypothetical protein
MDWPAAARLFGAAVSRTQGTTCSARPTRRRKRRCSDRSCAWRVRPRSATSTGASLSALHAKGPIRRAPGLCHEGAVNTIVRATVGGEASAELCAASIRAPWSRTSHRRSRWSGLGCELRHRGGDRFRARGWWTPDSTRSVYSTWTGSRRKVAAHLVGAPPAGDTPRQPGSRKLGG